MYYLTKNKQTKQRLEIWSGEAFKLLPKNR